MNKLYLFLFIFICFVLFQMGKMAQEFGVSLSTHSIYNDNNSYIEHLGD